MYTPFLGPMLLLLDDCHCHLQTGKLDGFDGPINKEEHTAISQMISFVSNLIQIASATSNDASHPWIASFQSSIPQFVESWWTRLSVAPELVSTVERCLLITGNLCGESAATDIVQLILQSPNGLRKKNLNRPDFFGIFVASWMHLLTSFETRYLGFIGRTSIKVLENLKSQEPDSIAAIMTGLHLTMAFEPQSHLMKVYENLSRHESWKIIFSFGSHENVNVAHVAIQLATAALPQSKFTTGKMYSILESCTQRLFELIRDVDDRDEHYDALEESFIKLIIKVCQGYQAGEVLVDTVVDCFFAVFTDPLMITSKRRKTLNASMHMLFIECIQVGM